MGKCFCISSSKSVRVYLSVCVFMVCVYVQVCLCGSSICVRMYWSVLVIKSYLCMYECVCMQAVELVWVCI